MIRFLQTQRSATKYALGAILLLICVSMVAFLIPGIGQNTTLVSKGGVVATVAGEDITDTEVRQTAQGMVRQQFRGQGGDQFIPLFAKQALDRMVDSKALVVEAGRLGLRVTDDEVKDELSQPTYGLYTNGKFDQDRLDGMLQQARITQAQLVDEVRQYLLVKKLEGVVAASVNVSPDEMQQAFTQQNTKVKFDYALINKDDVSKSLHPGDLELKAFYDKNKQNYLNSVPEKRQINYVILDAASLPNPPQVSPAEVQAFYNQHLDQYRVSDQVNVRHILIKTPTPGTDGKVDDKAVAAAKSKAEDILKQLKAGAKFEDLAKKDSEDPGSAAQGGSLGWVGRGATVPEFEKAAFGLSKGQLSDVIKTNYGFHILRLDDRQEAHVKPLAEVSSAIEAKLLQQKVTHAAENAATTLASDAKAKGLAAAAQAHSLKTVSTGFFGRAEGVPAVGPVPAVMDAVFSTKEKSPAQAVALPQGWLVFEVAAIQPPSTPSFEDIKTRVETEFKNERTGQLVTQKTQELSDKAKSYHDLKKAAKELGATFKTSDLVLPNGQVPEVGALTGPASVAFTMKPGDISGSLTASSNGLVLAVVDRQEPSAADFAQKKDQLREQILNQKRGDVFQSFVTNLRQRMEKSGTIKVNQKELNLLTGRNKES